MTAASTDPERLAGRDWALVRFSSAAEEYSPVRVTRRGKRFTYVQSALGEVRFTTRGLWDGMTEAEANAEINKMREARREIHALRARAHQETRP